MIDFDGTLSELLMQNLAKKYISLGAEVFITTSRSVKNNNDDLFAIADELGIPKERIKFTNFEDKYAFVKDYDMHFDDEYEEIYLINMHQSKCLGFVFEIKGLAENLIE